MNPTTPHFLLLLLLLLSLRELLLLPTMVKHLYSASVSLERDASPTFGKIRQPAGNGLKF
jgi:hypothetical protein